MKHFFFVYDGEGDGFLFFENEVFPKKDGSERFIMIYHLP